MTECNDPGHAHHATGCFAMALIVSVALNLVIVGLILGAGLR